MFKQCLFSFICTFTTTPGLTFSTEAIFVLIRAKHRSKMSLCIRQLYRKCPKPYNLSETVYSNVLSRVLMRDTPIYFHQVENGVPVKTLLYTKMVFLWHCYDKMSFHRDEKDEERTSTQRKTSISFLRLVEQIFLSSQYIWLWSTRETQVIVERAKTGSFLESTQWRVVTLSFSCAFSRSRALRFALVPNSCFSKWRAFYNLFLIRNEVIHWMPKCGTEFKFLSPKTVKYCARLKMLTNF